MSRKLLISLFILFSSAMIAIGRFYDHRLIVSGINLSIILSSFYSIFSIGVIYTIRKSFFTPNKFLANVLYFIMALSSLILWIFYGFTEYGFEKFINLILITIPISLIISEKFNLDDRNIFILVLLGISFFLFLISIINFSSIINSRSGVLGGGPIILSRWLCFGSIILFFHPRISKLKYILLILFITMSLFTGSRGPFYSLVFVFMIYILINFTKVFWKTILVISSLITLIYFTGIHTKLSEYNTVSRVFMNLQQGGINKSTGRSVVYSTSFNLIKNYPLGIGPGNFDIYSDKRQYLLSRKIFYPHNIFLEIFIEFGCLPFILFCLYIYFSMKKSYYYNIKSNREFGNLLFYTFLFLLFNSMISGDLNDARMLLIFIPLMNLREDANNL